jgi:hypothetical protein
MVIPPVRRTLLPIFSLSFMDASLALSGRVRRTFILYIQEILNIHNA